IYLGSKWPTFYVTWRKGVPKLFNSKIDFDYLEFGMEQKINLGVAGNTSYIIKSGDFTNTNDLRIIDYKFMRQGDPLFFQNPQYAFQALDSTFPVFDRYYQGNIVHEFNGALINKIPFFKKLKLQEVAGGGFLITKDRSLRYFEFFTGIERVFKWPFNPLARVKLGAYVVGSVANKFNNPVQFKIGLTTWDRFRNRWR
nr:carboxypeptidase-like regulatory domain-containing protein [Chitinophagaceae bacterium]